MMQLTMRIFWSTIIFKAVDFPVEFSSFDIVESFYVLKGYKDNIRSSSKHWIVPDRLGHPGDRNCQH